MGYDGWVKVGTELDTKKFDRQIEEVEAKLEEIDVMLSRPKEFELTGEDVKKLQLEAEKLNNKLIKLNQEKEKLEKSGLPNLKNIMNDINKSTSETIQKVGRWALAVFGIRGAYMAVRNAINIISQDDKQLANDIENMKRALAYTIEPIVRSIVGLMKELMNYLKKLIPL